MKNFLWTDEDTQTLIAMQAAGHSHADIGRAVNRSGPSVKEKWRWIRRSAEIMEARRERTNGVRRENRRSESAEPNHIVIRQQPVPDQLFVDRERRLSAQRTITGFLCGDPPPGFSALDRMGGSYAFVNGQ